MSPQERARVVDEGLEALYPDARLALHFENPFQLLVAIILSAQCTDERVNAVTPALFRRFPTPQEMAQAAQEELEALVKPTGFFRNKARAIRLCAQHLVTRFGGQVPQNLDDLLSLPGVGRKTANMLLGNAFGQQAIAVDTHVHRVARRLQLSDAQDPDRVEQDLCNLVPPPRWTAFGNRMILFGRHVCTSRAPRCRGCRFAEVCPSYAPR